MTQTDPTRTAAVERAPHTGWTRDRWGAFADRLVTAVRPVASPGHARVVLPGPEGGYGTAVDGLEGFARTFLVAGFRLAGEGGADPLDLAGWFARGLDSGTDPSSPERWVRLDEHPQAKVEAASLALVLDLTRPWIWDRLPAGVRERVVDYLAPAVGDPTYPRINWVWFRLVVQTFLRSVGGPWSPDDVAEDLATHDTFLREDDWLADGAERSFDHYGGWALHLYPTLWARMHGAADLAADRRETDRARLDRFLADAVRLVGADGSPLVQGRSLIYRFAAAAPFWVGAIAEVDSVPPGLLRRAASGVLGHFAEHGVPDERGLLTLGWHGAWPALAQSYSGPGSPYWAAKGLLGLALPADHPVWTDSELPLPVEQGGGVTALRAPGWIASATPGDGIVRIVNHGTDHAVADAPAADSPLYARHGYSTATAPLLDPESWCSPLDNAAVLLDDAGRASHRAGMARLATRLLPDGRVGLAASAGPVHWLEAAGEQPGHGSGLAGRLTPAGGLTCVSLVADGWEVHLVRVDSVAGAVHGRVPRLRVGGWPVAGRSARTSPGNDLVTAVADGLRSTLHAEGDLAVEVRHDAGPLGPVTLVPTVTVPARAGTWTWVATALARHPSAPPRVVLHGSHTVAVTWSGGHHTRLDLTDTELTDVHRTGAPPTPDPAGSTPSPVPQGES